MAFDAFDMRALTKTLSPGGGGVIFFSCSGGWERLGRL